MKADDKRIMAEGAAWAARTSQPGDGMEDAAAFERWMDASPAHRAAFAEMAALWRSDALAEAAAEVAAAPTRRRAPSIPWRRVATPALAAAAGVAMAALLTPWMDHRTVETARGETRTVALADGSILRMNGAARLSVRQGPLRRSVTLEQGETYFEVRPDRRPFTVDTGEGVVRVTGTAFNVDRLKRARTEVTLYRGAVRVRGRSGQTLDLVPGDRVVLERGRIRRATPTFGARPDWTDGWFDAEEATLGRLIEEIDRFSKTPIVIEGAASRIRISGRFHVAEPQTALALASRAYGVEADTTPGSITIRIKERRPDRR